MAAKCLALLNSLNAHNLPIFQPILMILVSKFMFYKTYLLLGFLPLLKQSLAVFLHYVKLFYINLSKY